MKLKTQVLKKTFLYNNTLIGQKALHRKYDVKDPVDVPVDQSLKTY